MVRNVISAVFLGLIWGGSAVGSPPVDRSDSSIELESDSPLQAEAMTEQRWIQVTSRMEAASADIGEKSRAVSDTARQIDESGRLSRLTQLSGHAIELDHKVIQARLAADQLIYP